VAAHVPAHGESAPLWPMHADGLGAWFVRAPAGATVEAPRDAGDGGTTRGGGRYYLVVEGAATHEGTALPHWSCVWTAAGAEAPALLAGPDGVGIVVVQFPARSPSARAPGFAGRARPSRGRS
jgi:hypothetical protein